MKKKSRKESPPLLLTIADACMIGLVGLMLFLPQSRSTIAHVYSLVGQDSLAEISTTSPQSLPLASTALDAPVKVPILVYHIVRPAYPTDSQAVRDLAQTPEVFEAQMQYLKDAGYTVIPFANLEAYFDGVATLPSHPIIVTLDDGWSDQFTYAFPVLNAFHYPATFFVFTNSIGRRDFLTWDNLKAILAAGMTIGSHSKSHPYLNKISDPAVLSKEIVDSKKILEEGLGVEIREFAYPFGRYTADIAALVEKAGYRSARGDFYSGEQSRAIRYGLSAMNAPTTLAGFERLFPIPH